MEKRLKNLVPGFENMGMERAVRVIVSGRVQGVFFRHHTMECARELGLRGYVRNLPDGTVEAVAAGDKEAVEKFIVFCNKGPDYARVDDVKVAELDTETASQLTGLTGFSVRY